MDNLPPHALRILQDKSLSVKKKMLALTAFVDVPGLSSGDDSAYKENLKIGNQIKKLIQDGRIDIKLRKDFSLEINEIG